MTVKKPPTPPALPVRPPRQRWFRSEETNSWLRAANSSLILFVVGMSRPVKQSPVLRVGQ